jgi:hypothetical protein
MLASGSFASVQTTDRPTGVDHQRGRSGPSLIRSLIQLRPEAFGTHHPRQAAQVADLLDLSQTQARRLGKARWELPPGARNDRLRSSPVGTSLRLWTAEGTRPGAA